MKLQNVSLIYVNVVLCDSSEGEIDYHPLSAETIINSPWSVLNNVLESIWQQ